MAAHLHRRLRLGQAGGLGDQIILMVQHQLPERPIQRRHALLQLLRLRLRGGVALSERSAGEGCGIEGLVPEGRESRAGEQLQRGAAVARGRAAPSHCRWLIKTAARSVPSPGSLGTPDGGMWRRHRAMLCRRHPQATEFNVLHTQLCLPWLPRYALHRFDYMYRK